MVRTEARCGEEARTYPASEFLIYRLAPLVVFSKLSKLLNQEDALGAPCLTHDSCSPRRALRGRRYADRFDPSLLLSHYCLLHPTRPADELPVVGGRCREAHRCKAKQGSREDRADVWNSCFQSSPIFGLCPE